MSYNTYNTIILKKYPQTTSQAPELLILMIILTIFLCCVVAIFNQPKKSCTYVLPILESPLALWENFVKVS